MKKKCFSQAKKMGQDNEKCLQLLRANNTNASFIGQEYFNNAFRKYLGNIKYYDFPSFKNSVKDDNELECYLGDLTKGFDKECRYGKNILNLLMVNLLLKVHGE